MAMLATVNCIPISATQCAIVIKQSQLLELAKDPSKLATDSESERTINKLSAQDKAARTLHNAVNRKVAHGKKKNIPNYRDYLEAIRGPRRRKYGLAPPIMLYHEYSLKYKDLQGGDDWEPGMPCLVQIPFGGLFVAIDGDSQLAARHLLQKDVEESGDDFVFAPLVHGESRAFARRAFCDQNLFGVKVSKPFALEMEDMDPLTLMAKQLREHYGPSQDKRGVPTLATFHVACRAFFGGRERAKDKEMIPEDEVMAAEENLFHWFDAVFDLLRRQFGSHSWGIASSQTLMVAIGAAGHRAYQAGTPEAIEAAIASLAQIDWVLGDHWLGIAAGKSQRKNDFGKIKAICNWESWINAEEALTNPESSLYHQIRHHRTTARAS